MRCVNLQGTCNLFLLSKISHFKKKSCMKLLYIFLLSFVVGSRRLSGYYY